MIDKDTYIYSDTHFGHENINKHEPIRKRRASENGFSNVDDLMIYNWNQSIKAKDTILHLGDFAFKHKDIANLSNKLNGKKILLPGNHDKPRDIEILQQNGWDIIDTIKLDIEYKHKERLLKKIDTQERLLCCYVTDFCSKRVMFSHFPLFNDNVYDSKYDNITKMLEFIYKELNCEINIHGHTHSLRAKEKFCKSACVECIDFIPKKVEDFIKDC